ncbi:hypothetical protein B0T13DRAFT_471540 [Neurospora crassa]|nr:hypothetical protein B0T13DRAFT_471540 [Neurospora crassa]
MSMSVNEGTVNRKSVVGIHSIQFHVAVLRTCTVILTHRYLGTYVSLRTAMAKWRKFHIGERLNGKVCSLKMGKLFSLFFFLLFYL